MKKIFSVLLLVTVIFTFAFNPPAFAADAAKGGKLFSANCAQCHAGGKNLVNPAKALKKEALEKFGMYSEEAIISQMTKGKGAMPAFKGRLKPEQMEDVAAYVLGKADKGWK